MKTWRHGLQLLVILAMLTAIPGIPLGTDLRGYPLMIHITVGTLLAVGLLLRIKLQNEQEHWLRSSAWLLLSTGLVTLVIPMLGMTSSDTTHLWLETHGWLSITGLALMAVSAAPQRALQEKTTS
ncbi:MAG: hypothetical protein P8K66_08125 [Planctomycetota bacterium]|nr:hypothetical protein [Planctomycetota bacterium]